MEKIKELRAGLSISLRQIAMLCEVGQRPITSEELITEIDKSVVEGIYSTENDYNFDISEGMSTTDQFIDLINRGFVIEIGETSLLDKLREVVSGDQFLCHHITSETLYLTTTGQAAFISLYPAIGSGNRVYCFPTGENEYKSFACHQQVFPSNCPEQSQNHPKCTIERLQAWRSEWWLIRESGSVLHCTEQCGLDFFDVWEQICPE